MKRGFESRVAILFIIVFVLALGKPGATQLSNDPAPTSIEQAESADEVDLERPAEGAGDVPEERGPADGLRKLLLPEGVQINGRAAKLVKLDKDDRWFLVFEPRHPDEAKETTGSAGEPDDRQRSAGDPLAQPMEVLPGKQLTLMTQVCNNEVALSVTFRVWAEVVCYHNRNYVLPKNIYTLALFGQDSAGTSTRAAPEESGSILDRALGTAEAPALDQGQLSRQSRKKIELPADLREALMAIPRTRVVRIPTVVDNGTSAQSSSPESKSTTEVGRVGDSSWREGHMVVDRVGRLAYDGREQRWHFAFEADGMSLADPPVVLHPCRLLEMLEEAQNRSTRPVKFRVSGQITRYHGISYMLLRKGLLVYDMGNLQK